MSLVFDKHEIEMKPLHDLLRENKMNFTQFLRTVNFVRDMKQEQLNDYIKAYKNGELDTEIDRLEGLLKNTDSPYDLQIKGRLNAIIEVKNDLLGRLEEVI